MRKRHILLVDDEPTMVSMLKELLETEGYQVSATQSGHEALDILQNHSIQVMCLDLCMPHMSGLELCREIKRRHPVSIVIAMSGYRSLFELVDCLEAGFEDFLPKPFDYKLLAREIERAFEKLDRWRRM